MLFWTKKIICCCPNYIFPTSTFITINEFETLTKTKVENI